jgi:hypothetical protein
VPSEASECRRRIRKVKQHEAPDERVKQLIRLECRKIGDPEPYVGYAAGSCAAARGFHRGWGPIDAEHAALCAHHGRGEQRHIADAAADVEHSHTGREAGALKYVSCKWLEQRGPLREA